MRLIIEESIQLAYQDANADDLQTQLDAVRDQFQGYVMISGMKPVIAHHKSDVDWVHVRPPLEDLTAAMSLCLQRMTKSFITS